MKYRREIDGLRAIAVLPVILFHAGMPIFSGGYVGVDIFFVISGYLITSIIISEVESGSFSIKKFYERRARRILPALFFVIFACIPFALAWMTPQQLIEFSKSIVAVTLFSSNILFWLESDYFAPVAELKPMLHTWSLAVEEQYYIFFPLFMLVAWRLGKRIVFFGLLTVGCVSLLLAQWGSATHPGANFYLLPTRLWELLLGSLVAIYNLNDEAGNSTDKGRRLSISQFLSSIGLVLIAYSIFSFDEETPFPSFYALVPTVGTVLVILFASKKTIVGEVLSNKFVVAIGLVSYSAYLWHQPLFAFVRIRSIGEPDPVLMLSLALLSLVLATVTWRYIEKPYRDRSNFSASQVFLHSGVAVLGVIGFGVFFVEADGFPRRSIVSGTTFLEAGLDEKVRPNYGLGITCDGDFTLSQDCRTSDEPEVLVWGDSFAMHLVSGILASREGIKIIQMTRSACGPLVGLAPINKKYPEDWAKECLSFNDSVAQWVEGDTNIRYAVLSSPFSQYFAEGSRIMTSDGVFVPNESVIYEHFSATLNFLVSQGIQPLVFAPPPSIGGGEDIGSCLVKVSIFGGELEECDFSINSYRHEHSNVISFLEKIDKTFRVIWMSDFLCSSGTCKAAVDGILIYRDAQHLSYEGAELIGSKMNFYELITAPNK